MPSSHICARRWLPVWLAVAMANATVALVLATDPARARDLETVRGWTNVWLFAGRDLYGSPIGSGTDYPPHAIVALSPIALLPASLASAVWAGINLLLAFVAPVLAARILSPSAPLPGPWCLVPLFLCWSGTRTLLQFTMLALVFGLLSLGLARRRPFWSGVCLALALMKPQVGVPFVLWIAFTRRWRVAASAGLVIACGTLLWCARAGVNPAATLGHYLNILAFYYTGDQSLAGIAQLRPLIAQIVPGRSADVAAGLVGLAVLCAICYEGFRWGRDEGTRLYAAPALAGVWSLLTFYHLTYGFVLLLPAMALLLLDDCGRTRRLRMAAAWALQIVMMVDLPGISRRLGLMDELAQHFYRIALPMLLIAIWIVHRRTVGRRPEIHDNYVT